MCLLSGDEVRQKGVLKYWTVYTVREMIGGNEMTLPHTLSLESTKSYSAEYKKLLFFAPAPRVILIGTG